MFWGQPWMTDVRIKRPEAEGAFFSIAKISFRNTSGLTNVPMSSAALTHCKEDREKQSLKTGFRPGLSVVPGLAHRASHLPEGTV